MLKTFEVIVTETVTRTRTVAVSAGDPMEAMEALSESDSVDVNVDRRFYQTTDDGTVYEYEVEP